MKSIPASFVCTIASLSLLLSGCGEKQTGPQRYSLSGSVTMNGKPVPAGEVSLEPDFSAGNKGPQSTVQIKDGQYSLPVDQGVIGGKYTATIIAYDGVPVGMSEQGTALLKTPYVEKIDLPKEDTTKDFVVK